MSASQAASESLRIEQEQREKLISELKLKRPGPTKKAKEWKSELIYVSDLPDRKNQAYCIKCREWIKSAQPTNLSQHLSRNDKEEWAALLAKYGNQDGGDSDAGSVTSGGSRVTGGRHPLASPRPWSSPSSGSSAAALSTSCTRASPDS
jgi:hypothetical protein